jgi:hypothetical protein
VIREPRGVVYSMWKRAKEEFLASQRSFSGSRIMKLFPATFANKSPFEREARRGNQQRHLSCCGPE